MSALRDRAIQEHINNNYPNSKLLNYNDPDSDLMFCSAKELQNIDYDWFPLCCFKDENGKTIYGGRKGVVHTYIEGETGAGKTTRFVMQSIYALSSLKEKPSFVIVDIHGEIIESLYKHLKANGYDIKILNCDNPQRSDTYNPFYEIAEECIRTKTISSDAINMIRKIAEIIQPVESGNDPIWEIGARSYTNGCILDKFEDLISGDITKECLTIYNVIHNHYWLRNELAKVERYDRLDSLFLIPHYKKKGMDALSVQKMVSVANNAEKTRKSYFGVVENHFDIFGQPSLYALSSSNTINISDFINKPTVIVIQSGNTTIGDALISLLVNEIYTRVVKMGKESRSKKLPRKIHCFLDEFANCNIADGPEFIKMLTTSRKFGMFWHMILQCDAQIDRKYDANIGKIIRANSTEVFMGSHDYETEVRFAKSCGQKTIESLASTIDNQKPLLEVVDLMTTERLNLIEEGNILIKSNRRPLTRTYIEAFYKCEEYDPAENIDDVYPHNTFDYHQTLFTPDDIPPDISSIEYKMLKYIQSGGRTVEGTIEHFSEFDGENVFYSGLIEKSLVNYYFKTRATELDITQNQIALYDYREQKQLNATDVFYIPVENEDDEGEYEYYNQFDFATGTPFSDTKASVEEQRNETGKLKFYELKDYIIERGIDEVANGIKNLTSIPEDLAAAIEYIRDADNADDGFSMHDCDLSIFEKINMLKFVIIEIFITRNDFETKELWDEAIQREYDQLVEQQLFPQFVMDGFKSAVDELQNELTLGNIREIKKIISDND